MRFVLVMVGVPLLVGLAVAVPVSVAFGPQNWTFAGIAFALTVPPGLVTLALGHYLIRTHPLGRVLAMAAGTFVRLVAGFGGGVVVFFAAGPTERSEKAAFWLWILFAYLVTLALETALLARWKPAQSNA